MRRKLFVVRSASNDEDDVRCRNECAEQCLKRKRDQENEIREMRKLLTDKDERIKLLDNEIKVERFDTEEHRALAIEYFLDSSEIS